MTAKFLGLVLALVALSVSAQSNEVSPATIRVQGEGTVAVNPDRARIEVGVATSRASADAAVSANNAVVTRVLSALRSAGVDADDIQTTQFNIYPQRNNNGTPSGFRASNSVSVTTDDLDKVGVLLGAAVDAGANQVNGVSFFLSQQDAAVQEALALAVADAERKATAIAMAAGQTLGPALSIDNVGSGGPVGPAMVNFSAIAAEAASTVPIEIGTHRVRTQVTVVFSAQ